MISCKHVVGAAAVSVLAILLWSSSAQARLRAPYTDWEVVGRSDLIVVGHLKQGSIEYVAHKTPPGSGISWEHHATLVVTEVLKGDFKAKETPVVIGYGLDPVVGGYLEETGHSINLRGDRKDYPKDIIEIVDTSDGFGGPLVKDAGEDNLWLLRCTNEAQGKLAAGEAYGIDDPGDLRPLALKDYLTAYLAKDPEAAVRAQLPKTPDLPGVKDSAQRFFDHCEIQRLLKVADAKERIRGLLPYYFQNNWPTGPEAQKALIACGPDAGAAMRPLLDDPKYKDKRQAIIRFWVQSQYEGCVDVLIDLLKQADQYWAKQDLQKGWWNQDTSSALTQERWRLCGDMYYAVSALRQIGDPRARPVVEMTLQRWQTPPFENTQIVEECTAALKAFAEKDKKPK